MFTTASATFRVEVAPIDEGPDGPTLGVSVHHPGGLLSVGKVKPVPADVRLDGDGFWTAHVYGPHGHTSPLGGPAFDRVDVAAQEIVRTYFDPTPAKDD